MTLITMTPEELSRLRIIESLLGGDLKPAHAAQILNLSVRQVHRLKHSYVALGPSGLVNTARGKPSNRTTPQQIKEMAVGLLRTHYADFGPTFAAEKLREKHGLSFAPMTVRRWMKEDGLWIDRRQRKPAVHQPRPRRECYGELIQIDGSQHYWFENRGHKCTLLVYIDDATSKLMHMKFVECESAFAYFAATAEYIDHHGKPVAFYSDKHSIFRVTKKDAAGGTGMTQFGRALHELNIDIICANTPQAKGRVERANRTLQDRLVKELRLAGICTMEEGNAFLPAFIQDYNGRFGKDALNPKDLHRSLSASEQLRETFVWREERKVTDTLTVRYDKSFLLLDRTDEFAQSLARKHVTVTEYPNGDVRISYNGLPLSYKLFDTICHVDQGAIVDNKRLGPVLQHIQKQQALRPQYRSEHAPRRRAQQENSPFQAGAPLSQKRRVRRGRLQNIERLDDHRRKTQTNIKRTQKVITREARERLSVRS
jgi:Winged helix-turn helix